MSKIVIAAFVMSAPLGYAVKNAYAECVKPATCVKTLIQGAGKKRYNCPVVSCSGTSGEYQCIDCRRVAGTGGPGGYDDTLVCGCKVG